MACSKGRIFVKRVCFPFQGLLSFEEVVVLFVEEAETLMDPDQKALCGEVMEENYRTEASVGKSGLWLVPPFVLACSLIGHWSYWVIPPYAAAAGIST